MSEYRIDFQVMRRLPGEEDFTEHGFGSTCASGSIYEAAHDVLSALQNNEWDVTND